jgi:SecD/SecF fusion protein
MKHQFFWKFVICLVPCIAAGAAVAEAVIHERFKLGVDLVGGTVLVYEVENPDNLPQGYKPEELAASLKRRIDPTDLYNVTIRPVGNTRVEIILPTGGRGKDERHKNATAEEVQDIKRKIAQVGSLEFRMLAIKEDDKDGIARAEAYIRDPRNQDELTKMALEGKPPPGPTKEDGDKIFDLGERGKVSYSWVELGRQERRGLNLDNAALTDTTTEEGKKIDRSWRWKEAKEARDSTRAADLQFADYISPETLQPLLKKEFEAEKKPGFTTFELHGEEKALHGDEKLPSKDGSFRVFRLDFTAAVDKDALKAALQRVWDSDEFKKLKLPDPTVLFGSDTIVIALGNAPGEVDILYSRKCVSTKLPEKERDEKKYEYFLLARDPELDPATGEPKAITGKYLSNAFETLENMQPAVGFRFDNTGSNLFYDLTSKNIPTGSEGNKVYRHLAILLDGQIVSAPRIQSAISGNGVISGHFKRKEVTSLVNVLRSGALPATLKGKPVSENTMGATLGGDTIDKGVRAVGLAFIVILIFMIIYYRFAGFVASLALLANLLLTVGFMVAVNATFTLPGLAGLVLMIGMAVDANVLIYERLREERDRGASLALAIRNGYDRAFPTIIDTHLSSIFTAIVLYAVGNDQLKGFGISLTVGLIISLFTSLYMTRLLFDFWLAKGWLHKLSMFRLFSRPNIDFMGIRYYWFTATILLTVFGITVFLIRGDKGLNIDFVGGTTYGGQLTEPEDIGTLREALSEKRQEELLQVSKVEQNDADGFSFTITYSDGSVRKVDLPNVATPAEVERRASVLPDLSVEQIFVDKPGFTDGNKSKVFNIRTTEKAPDLVQASINRLLGDKLEKIQMIFYPDQVTARGAILKFYPQTPHMEELRKALDTGDTDEILKLFDSADQERVRKALAAGDTEAVVKMYRGIAYASPAALEMLLRRELKDHGLAAEAEHFTLSKVALDAPEEEGRWHEARLEFANEVDRAKLLAALQDTKREFDSRAEPLRLENFDKQLAGETQMRAMYAILASWAAILLYLWFRFGSWTFGLAAVLCLIHDLFFTMGIIAFCHWLHDIPFLGRFLLLEDFKIDLPAVAALLTLVGYSVNDTIVVFDRIREVRGKNPELTPQMINDSVNQTLSRTLLTSFATWLVVIVLYIFGGEGVHLFAFVMVVGVIVGTYSSIYIASPLLLIFGEGAKPARARQPQPEPAV